MPRKEPHGRSENGDEARALADLVNRLVARFGRENLRRFVARDTHDPVRAGGMAAFLATGQETEWTTPEPASPPHAR